MKTRRQPFSYFPFFPEDFEAGTSHLAASEVGGYVRLLCRQWSNGSIPNNVDDMSRIMGCTRASARSIWERIKDKFELGDDNRWRNARMERERAKAVHKSECASASIRARWDREGTNYDGNTNVLPPNNEGNTMETEKEKKIPPKPPKGARYSPDFLAFWDAYPNKTGKDAAWRKWEVRRKAGDLPSLEPLIAALTVQRQSRQWRDGFIPHPSTWLNQGRWADQPAAAVASSGPPMPFWDECAKCGDIHPVGQACAKGAPA